MHSGDTPIMNAEFLSNRILSQITTSEEDDTNLIETKRDYKFDIKSLN